MRSPLDTLVEQETMLEQPAKTSMNRAVEDIEQGRIYEASSVEDLINQCKA